jgi:hypothetical protein
VPNPSSREEISILEEPIISNLEAEDLGPYNPPIIDLSAPIVIPVLPYKHPVVSSTTMEANVATSSGNTVISLMNVTTGGVPPPNQPSSVQATMPLTASTSGSGLIPSMVVITTPFPQNTIGSPFSYGMPSFSMSTVLSSSTLQTLGLSAGSSNASLKGSIGGTYAPFIIFPYGGGHIPPSSPSLTGVPQHSARPNINLFGAGSQALPPYNMSNGLTPFSFFGTFGNNAFSSAVFSTGGNPDYGQPHPVQGAHLGIPSSQGSWNQWQGPVPLPGMSIRGNPFHTQWNPRKGPTPMDRQGATPPKILGM